MKIFVFDLDGTICLPDLSYQDTWNRYANATPLVGMIDQMKSCRQSGVKIIIHTARRMLTHNGDVQKVINDVGEVTKDWLEKHEVPYDELIFGKPYGDLYIDDKACLPEDFSV